MNVYVGADHNGFALKEKILDLLRARQIRCIDAGNLVLDKNDDYPLFAAAVARSVAADPGSRGILICGSAQGMCIAANKVKGIRAVTIESTSLARKSREHDDAQIVCLSAWNLTWGSIREIITAFLETSASSAQRHQRRLEQLRLLEYPAILRPALLAQDCNAFVFQLSAIGNLPSSLHLDVMDGVFVPQRSLYFEVPLPLWHTYDAHLMVKNPVDWMTQYGMKVTTALFHQQHGLSTLSTIQQLRKLKKKVGIVLNPEDSVASVKRYLRMLDVVLVLCVHPGKYHGRYIPSCLRKVKELRCIAPLLSIGVDGGMTPATAEHAFGAGATYVVSGSHIMLSKHPDTTYAHFLKECASYLSLNR